jgi:hypothetical protein
VIWDYENQFKIISNQDNIDLILSSIVNR